MRVVSCGLRVVGKLQVRQLCSDVANRGNGGDSRFHAVTRLYSGVGLMQQHHIQVGIGIGPDVDADIRRLVIQVVAFDRDDLAGNGCVDGSARLAADIGGGVHGGAVGVAVQVRDVRIDPEAVGLLVVDAKGLARSLVFRHIRFRHLRGHDLAPFVGCLMHDHAGELVLRDGGVDVNSLALGEQSAGMNLFRLLGLRGFFGHGDIGDVFEDHGTLACGDGCGFANAEGTFDQRLCEARARDGEKGDYREQRDGNGDGWDEASKTPVLFLLDRRRCIGSGIRALCGVSVGGIGNVHGSCTGGVVHIHGCPVGGVLHIGGRTIGCGLGVCGSAVNGNGPGCRGIPVRGASDRGLGACAGMLPGVWRTCARGVLPDRIDRRDAQPVRTRTGGPWCGPVLGASLLGCVCA